MWSLDLKAMWTAEVWMLFHHEREIAVSANCYQVTSTMQGTQEDGSKYILIQSSQSVLGGFWDLHQEDQEEQNLLLGLGTRNGEQKLVRRIEIILLSQFAVPLSQLAGERRNLCNVFIPSISQSSMKNCPTWRPPLTAFTIHVPQILKKVPHHQNSLSSPQNRKETSRNHSHLAISNSCGIKPVTFL